MAWRASVSQYDAYGERIATVDGRGVPVKFICDDDTGKVTFTLAKCVGCNAEVSQLNRK